MLVSGQNIGDYVTLIKKYLNNPDVAINKAEKGYKFIVNHYTAKKNSDAYLKLYRDLTS